MPIVECYVVEEFLMMNYAYAETSNKTMFSNIAAVLLAIRSYALQPNRKDAELHIELAARGLYNINLQSVFLPRKDISTQGHISPNLPRPSNCLQGPP